MDRMGYPRGLVRYTTENALQGQKTSLLRPRVLIYATLLVVLAGVFVTGIAMRTPLRLDILPDRNTLFREVQGGLVENVYTLKVMNMDQQPHTYTVDVTGLPGLVIETQPERIRVEPGQVRTVPATIRADPAQVQGSGHDITLTLRAADQSAMQVVEETRFHTPVQR